MQKAPKSRAEIERLVLCELQTCGDCEGAAGIAIVRLEGRRHDSQQLDSANWTVAAYDAGTANDYACERALMSIVSRFQGLYELVQKH